MQSLCHHRHYRHSLATLTQTRNNSNVYSFSHKKTRLLDALGRFGCYMSHKPFFSNLLRGCSGQSSFGCMDQNYLFSLHKQHNCGRLWVLLVHNPFCSNCNQRNTRTNKQNKDKHKITRMCILFPTEKLDFWMRLDVLAATCNRWQRPPRTSIRVSPEVARRRHRPETYAVT